ncbi:serine hydrolase [Pseudidiomarina sp. 1APP75-32.1]|uniref:Serine hydrolase n=1 Tax=Pseudidiomarina terrestris TaxID=2820060 RepID=A0AAW7QX85_9GAMM|nr:MULTISPECIES: serine hydrolase [unclassified Pseudidiomarina]MDN7123438.1 serine hydrolase [Pseudidiomarina sp. 1APP75-32.1]MDN7128836.1 serine hydrolase [Pseudidiomarina sp. 1APR75-15]
MTLNSIRVGLLASALLLIGCNEPGYPEHLQVQRIDQSDLQALLIAPKESAGALPTVIVLGGSDGGLGGAQATAQALAEEGIAALAVGYFGLPNLPETLNSIPLEYFDAALNYIDTSTQLSRNQCQQVPVMGSSRGAELALLLGANSSDYGPVMAIAPSSHVWGAVGDTQASAWTRNGQPLTFVPRHSNPDYSAQRFIGRGYFQQDLQHADAVAARIDVNSIQAEVLLFAGADDQLWPADEMAQTIQAQLATVGPAARVTSIIYPAAGHAIAPGLPKNLTEVTLGNSQTIVLGGRPDANAAAQEDILRRAVNAIKNPICYDSTASFDDHKLDELEQFLQTSGTSSMVLMRAGEVVFEYGDIHEKHTIHSIRKAMLNSLYGIYVERGIIDLDATLAELGIDDSIPLTATEKTATVRQLLKSRSGIYLPSAATAQSMLAGMPPRGEFEPGEQYIYNNWDFNVAGAIFEKLTGESIYTAFYREIAKPLGMQDFKGSYTTIDEDTDISQLEVDGFYQYEPELSKFPAYHFRMSAYDMALYGQLYENFGVWNGQRILSREWIEQSTTSYSLTNRYMDFGYGMLWNVINPNEQRPEPAFFHTGIGIHMLGVYPSSDLVFVHRVHTETDYHFDQQNLYSIIGQVFGALETRHSNEPADTDK